MCLADDFCSPWMASFGAFLEAFDCGYVDRLQPTCLPDEVPQNRRHAGKSVHFSEDIEVHFGSEDEWKMFPIRIDHGGLSSWTDKPWSYRPSPRWHRTEETAAPRLPGYQQVTIQGMAFDVPPLTDLPAWAQQLWPAFHALARVWRRGEDPTSYCRTWFLDDANIHQWHSWRELRLDPYSDYWHDELLRLWQDQLHPGASLQILVVEPPVPPIPGWETHLGDVLLVQSPCPRRRAILVSTLLREPLLDKRSLTAFSVPVDQPRHELLRLTGMMFPSWRNPCTIARGTRELLDGRIHHLAGSGIFIKVVLEDDVTSFMQRPASASPHLALADPPGTVTPFQHPVPSPHAPGSWRSAVLDLWTCTMVTDPTSLVIFDTWFIHHDHQRHSFFPRSWTATLPLAAWETELRRLWEDLVTANEPIEVYVVTPVLPAHSATRPQLLVVQGQGAYVALLLTTVFHGMPGYNVAQIAVSSFAHVDGFYILRLAGASRYCDDHLCQLQFGDTQLPLGAPSELLNGMGLLIQVREPHAHPEDAVSFLAAAPNRVDHVENIPLLDRAGIAQDPEEEDDLDLSSEDPTESSMGVWHTSTIYSIKLAPVHGHTDWSDYDSLKASTIDLLHPDAHDMQAVHHVSVPPTDHEDDSDAVFLAEMPEDAGHDLRLILVDLVLYQNRPDYEGDLAIRFVRALSPATTRRDLLRSLGVEAYCEELMHLPSHPACLVWLNFDIVAYQNEHSLGLQHGDYVQVALPPAAPLPQDFPVRVAAAICDTGVPLTTLQRQLAEGAVLNHSIAEEVPRVPDLDVIDSDADDFALFQSLSLSADRHPAAAFPDAPPSYNPGVGRPGLDTPQWLQDLFYHWLRDFQTRGVNETSACWPFVTTWYLDHDRVPQMTVARDLALRPNTGTWFNDLVALWRDLVDPGVDVQVHLVRPPPFAAPLGPFAHLILVQNPSPLLASVLVALVDDDIDPWSSHITALAAPRTLLQTHLIAMMGYTAVHAANPPLRTCATAARQGPFTDVNPARIDDGEPLLLTVTNITPDPVATADSVVLLQQRLVHAMTTISTTTTCAASTQRPPTEPHVDDPVDPPLGTPTDDTIEDVIEIDFSAAYNVFHRLDTHFLLPAYIFPPDTPWHPASMSWLALPLWDDGLPCHELCVYHDGGYDSETKSAGFGVISFLRSGSTWYFGGALAGPLDCTSAYQAELCGALVATKFLFDKLKIILLTQPEPPFTWVGFDSLTVGKQAAGNWHCLSVPHFGILIRSLRDLLRLRFHATVHDYHISAHRGEPGNEAADTLATQGQLGLIQTPLGCLLDFANDRQQVDALAWMWMLFDSSFAEYWSCDGVLRVPRHPCTQPPTDLLPALHPTGDCAVDTGQLELTLYTFNVLTLKANEVTTGVGGNARLDSLLQQLQLAKSQIFGLQETRLKRSNRLLREDYILLFGPANDQGQGGVMLGLSRTIPHGHVTNAAGRRTTEVFFDEHCYSLIHASFRQLIVRISTRALRAIVVVAHAPHTGASFDELQTWWTDLAHIVPDTYKSWPRLLLTDANARIGAVLSPSVGPLAAEVHSDKSQPFLDFVHSSDVFLPATFEEHHTGDSGTWRHPVSGWKRNDYIGVPLAWSYTSLVSWVDMEIDLTLLHEDHRPACVSLTTHCNGKMPDRARGPPKPQPADLAWIDWDHLQCSLPHWTCDVHSHYQMLHGAILEQAAVPQRRAQPHKLTMSQSTWTLVQAKRECRQLLHEADRTQRLASGLLYQLDCCCLSTRPFPTTSSRLDGFVAPSRFAFGSAPLRVSKTWTPGDGGSPL